MVVANQRHGLLDGIVLACIVAARRQDFRLLANSVLYPIPKLQRFIIPVDVFQRSAHVNGMAARSAIRWLRSGGAVISFPAGEVSAVNGVPLTVTDRDWSSAPTQMAASARAKIVQVHVAARNSLAFQFAGYSDLAIWPT